MKYIFILFFCVPLFSLSQSRWSFELNGGVVYNFRLPLIIHQHGFPDILIKRARYQSEPLNDPPYGMWRISKWFSRSGDKSPAWLDKKNIGFEYTHHKIYLVNTTPEVQSFNISHGFNMLTFNYGMEKGKFIFRGGLGSALIHTESTIRGMPYPYGPGFDLKGYRLRGIVLLFSAARQFKLSKTFFINSEVKISGSVVNASVVNGYARVHVVALQLVLGPGFNWAVKDD